MFELSRFAQELPGLCLGIKAVTQIIECHAFGLFDSLRWGLNWWLLRTESVLDLLFWPKLQGLIRTKLALVRAVRSEDLVLRRGVQSWSERLY